MLQEAYVEKIAERHMNNPFTPLYHKYGVDLIKRLHKHKGLSVGDEIVLLQKKGNKTVVSYGVINYIVEIITLGELYEKVVFLLKDCRGLSYSHIFEFNEKNIISLEKFSLSQNTILLSKESSGSYMAFDVGYGGFDSVSSYRVLKVSVSRKNKLGDLEYDTMIPPIEGAGLPKNFPLQSKKHISNMKLLDDIEIKELRARGFNILFVKSIGID